MRSDKLALLLFTLLLSHFIYSQKDKTHVEILDEVIITATRTLREISSLPLPAKLISKKEIQNINSTKLIDVLNEQTGLVTVPDYGGGQGVQLQGMDSQYTLILIDGVPLVGRLAGTLDLSRISVGNIKQIEIIKGASSSLYGNEALGGVINIITDKPKWGINGDTYLRFDSFSTLDTGGTIEYKEDNLGLIFFINHYKNEGYDLDKKDKIKTIEPFLNNTLSTKAKYNFSEDTNLLLSARYYYQEQDVCIKDASGKGFINEWNTQIKLSHTLSEKWKSFLELYTTKYTTKQYYQNENKSIWSKSNFNQLLVKPEFRVIYEPKKHNQFIMGIGITHETLDKSYFIEVPKFNAMYSYLQYDKELFDKLNIIGGIRYDKHNVYGSKLSPKISARYKIIPNLNLKASIGYGFKTPDFRQLYNNFTNAAVGYTVLGYNAVKTRMAELEKEGVISKINVPSSDFDNELKPENSIAYNIGFDLKINSNIKFDVNFFKNDIKNLIDTYSIAKKTNGWDVFAYHNIDNIYTQGIETNFKCKLHRNLNLTAGYQYLLAKDKDAENKFKKGEIFAGINDTELSLDDYFGLVNRSKHMANIKLFYQIPKWNLNANIRATYRSKYGLSDTNGNNYLDNYDKFIKEHTIWNSAINKTFYKKYKLSIGVDNILNFKDKKITNIQGRIIYGKIFIKF